MIELSRLDWSILSMFSPAQRAIVAAAAAAAAAVAFGFSSSLLLGSDLLLAVAVVGFATSLVFVFSLFVGDSRLEF